MSEHEANQGTLRPESGRRRERRGAARIAALPARLARLAPGAPRAARASVLSRIALLAALAAVLACGQEFRLPPAPPPEPVPDAGRYHYEKSWTLPEPQDVAISGSYLYVIVRNDGADPDTSVKTRVEVYLTRRPDPTPPPPAAGNFRPFEGLTHPVRLCVARRESTWVFVADAGDSTIKRFHFTGGAPRATFQHRRTVIAEGGTGLVDTLVWKGFDGLAADEALNVYLADARRDTVACYDDAGRFLRAVSTAGSGDGYCISAHGMEWNGQELLVSDTGQGRVVLLNGSQSEVATRPPVGARLDQPSLRLPLDTAGDRNGQFVYVADTGNDRLLKYRLNGEFVDSVYSARAVDPRLGTPILEPRFLAVEEPLVFLSDPAHNRLVAFALADSF